MSQDIQQAAAKVVALFKKELNQQSSSCLSENDYELLRDMISLAISAERTANAELLERIAAKIKSGIEKPDLDL